jgi:hypothetical protein
VGSGKWENKWEKLFFSWLAIYFSHFLFRFPVLRVFIVTFPRKCTFTLKKNNDVPSLLLSSLPTMPRAKLTLKERLTVEYSTKIILAMNEYIQQWKQTGVKPQYPYIINPLPFPLFFPSLLLEEEDGKERWENESPIFLFAIRLVIPFFLYFLFQPITY